MEVREEAVGRPLIVWEAPDGTALAGIGAACRIEASGQGRFHEVQARLASERPTVALGGFAFQEQGTAGGWPGFPDALFLVPELAFWRRSGRETLQVRHAEGIGSETEPVPPEPGAVWDQPSWNDAVRRSLARIREGSLEKVVLARSMVIPVGRSGGALDILATLREMYPTCYRYLIDDGRGTAFVGASPERLVSRHSEQFFTEAIAGTQRCGPGDDPDAMERELLARLKDRREHEVVVRHLLEALAPMSIGDVETDPTEVMRLPHLLHLRTRVRGWARAKHVLDYVACLHPTPAVAGWPREDALDWIRDTEAMPRGWYAGCVGWVDGFGDGDFAVGIRSIAIRGNEARVFAGAGIVEGSDPEQEWNETELKMQGMLDAIARG